MAPLAPFVVPALIGAGVGAGTAAATGGDVGKGALFGAVGGAYGGYAAGASAGGMSATAGAVAGGAVGASAGSILSPKKSKIPGAATAPSANAQSIKTAAPVTQRSEAAKRNRQRTAAFQPRSFAPPMLGQTGLLGIGG